MTNEQLDVLQIFMFGWVLTVLTVEIRKANRLEQEIGRDQRDHDGS